MNWKFIRIIDACFGIPIIFGISIGTWLFGKKKPTPSLNPKRILLIKFWGIGNIFLLLPSIQALRAAHPDATISFLTLDSNRDALECCGAADSIITINTATPLRFLATWLQAAVQLRRDRYDIIIDFEQFARFSALIANQIGAPEIIGFQTKGTYRSCNYTRQVPYDNTVHIKHSFFSLSMAAGAKPLPPLSTIGLGGIENLRRRGRELLVNFGIKPEGICIVMHVGTSDNFRERRWLPERFAVLADSLYAEFDVRTIFTGLPEESLLTREAIRHLRSPSSACDLGGRLNFTDYFALITVADLVISADTAAVHMASAVDTPIVGLYGPNTPLLYGPWGARGLAIFQKFDCSPCITNFNAKLHTCRHPAGRGACMRAIGVADTFQKIQSHYFDPEAPCRLEKLDMNR